LFPRRLRERRFWSLALIEQGVDSKKENLLWLMTNIPDGKAEDGQTVVEYEAPAPPVNGGLYRYVYLLMSQKAQIDYEIKIDSQFNIKGFYKQHQLNPKGIVFCHSKWHPSVESASDRIARVELKKGEFAFLLPNQPLKE